MTPQLEAVLKGLPDRPGVYLFKDARGTVLYVGKAASLGAAGNRSRGGMLEAAA